MDTPPVSLHHAPMSDQHALVIGATGLVGSLVVERLLATPSCAAVTVLARRPSHRSHPKLVWRVVDFDDPGSWALPPGTTLFNCMGTTIKQAGSQEEFQRVDHHIPLAVARAAHAVGAQHCLSVSSLGASSRSTVFYSRVKGQLEEALQQVGFARLDILRPSLLLGERAHKRFGEQIGALAMRGLGFLLQGPLRQYRGIAGDAVAAAMVELASAVEPGVYVHPSPRLARGSLLT
ncbi:MAG: NAD-dependent epimerase/dehydratase family protein [Myxococcota bacterium]